MRGSDPTRPGPPFRPRRRRAGGLGGAGRAAYAAIDLGTNNCRLLIAEQADTGFRVLDSFSSMVRLGEGLAATGRLSEAAMSRTLSALEVCAAKMKASAVTRVRCVATQACRVAENGLDFLERIRVRLGLRFALIEPEEEAQLAVLGCASLIDAPREVALVVDVGGGSTELSWVDARRSDEGPFALSILRSISLPYGVVTLAERVVGRAPEDWFQPIVGEIGEILEQEPHVGRWRDAFASGDGLVIGASGTLTSLAGVHLGLTRYVRSKVDGLWMTASEIDTASRLLLNLTPQARAANACIGPERADLVLPGAAILNAVMRAAPAPRIRVADRGLREGMLITLMNEAPP